MKQANASLNNLRVGRRIDLSVASRRIATGAIGLMLGLAAVSAPPHAAATPICAIAASRCTNATVYLFGAGGTPHLEPDAYITSEGGVYTDSGFLGTIDAYYNIVDAENNIIGYVTYPSPD